MQIRQIVRVSDQGVSRPYQCYDEKGVLARQVVTEAFLDCVWSEMPTEWTEIGCEALPFETVKGVLLREEF